MRLSVPDSFAHTPPVMRWEFSLKRAIRLACLALEICALLGVLSELAVFLGLFLVPHFVWIAILRFVALAILSLLTLQFCSLFINWRRALFGLARAVIYLLLAGVPLTRLP